MNKRILITTLALVALLTVSALAQQGHGRRASTGMHMGHDQDTRLEYLAEVLDLTDDQQASMEKIHDEARLQQVDLKKSMARLKNEIEGEMLKDEPSEKTLVQLTENLGSLRTEMQVIKVKTRLAVRALLTEDQQDQMLLMRERHGQANGRGHGGKHGRHYPGKRGGQCRSFAPTADDQEGKI